MSTGGQVPAPGAPLQLVPRDVVLVEGGSGARAPARAPRGRAPARPAAAAARRHDPAAELRTHVSTHVLLAATCILLSTILLYSELVMCSNVLR